MGAMASGRFITFGPEESAPCLHDDKLGFIYIHIYINIDKSKAPTLHSTSYM